MNVLYTISDFGNPVFASISLALMLFLWVERLPAAARIVLAGLVGPLISRGPTVFSRISDTGNDAEVTFAIIHFAVYLPLSFLAAWLVTRLLERKFPTDMSAAF